jgi:hypothetical protein
MERLYPESWQKMRFAQDSSLWQLRQRVFASVDAALNRRLRSLEILSTTPKNELLVLVMEEMMLL